MTYLSLNAIMFAPFQFRGKGFPENNEMGVFKEAVDIAPHGRQFKLR